MSLLEVRELDVSFGRRRAPAVRGVSFSLDAGQRLGVIGESGSGKTVTALAVTGLLPENAHVGGSVRLGGTEMIGLDERGLAR
ncbi:MAG: ABC transporter ATP-binding protein, partial [Phenylobacterium zucineum]